MTLYIGLMSGTSLDGVDGVLVDFASPQGPPVVLQAHHHQPFPAALRSELLALNAPGDNELQRAELAANAIARSYAEVVHTLLRARPGASRAVRAIGAHGQTVRHRPGEFDGTGFTSQLLNGALLAELTGIDVVCDLRRRDVAAGGQGAPLAPGLHAALFASPGQSRVVLNLGGIANLSLLNADGSRAGLRLRPRQCPARWLVPAPLRPALRPRWAMGGQRQRCRAAAGCTTGRAVHRPAAAQEHRPRPLQPGLARCAMSCATRQAFAAVDVQATLAALTVHSVARHVRQHARAAKVLLVCGGGAHNTHLMRELATQLPDARVTTTDSVGLPVDQVEGAAFAWLAQRFVERLPGNIVAVTGARGLRVLGALYPA